MVEGHTVERTEQIWTLRLRDGLQFHDGTPVLARDAVASIRRFAEKQICEQMQIQMWQDITVHPDGILGALDGPSPRHRRSALGLARSMACEGSELNTVAEIKT